MENIVVYEEEYTQEYIQVCEKEIEDHLKEVERMNNILKQEKPKDYAWLLYLLIIAIAILASSCGVKPQPVSQDTPSLAGISIADSIQFELKAEYVTELVFIDKTPVTGDTVCAYIVDTTMYIQQFVANQIPYHKYQNRMFKFVWNN